MQPPWPSLLDAPPPLLVMRRRPWSLCRRPGSTRRRRPWWMRRLHSSMRRLLSSYQHRFPSTQLKLN
jgi:hypothetical protein